MENAEILRFEQETNAKTGYIYTLEKSKHALKVVPMEPTKKKTNQRILLTTTTTEKKVKGKMD